MATTQEQEAREWLSSIGGYNNFLNRLKDNRGVYTEQIATSDGSFGGLRIVRDDGPGKLTYIPLEEYANQIGGHEGYILNNLNTFFGTPAQKDIPSTSTAKPMTAQQEAFAKGGQAGLDAYNKAIQTPSYISSDQASTHYTQQAGLTGIQQSLNALQNRINTEGITDENGKVLLAPKGTPNFTLPNGTTGTPDLTGAGSFLAGTEAGLAAEEAERARLLKVQETNAQNQQNSLIESLKTGMKNWLSPSEARNESFEDIGIKPAEYFAERQVDIAKMKSLQDEYGSLEAQKLAAMQAEDARLASTGVIDRKKQQLENQYNLKLYGVSAKINSQAAIMAAQQNNWTQAQQFVNQAVEDYMAGINFEYKQFETFFNINKDQIDRLDSNYQSALTNSLNLKASALKSAREEQLAVGELMMNNPKANIQIGDTLENAQRKIALSGGTAAYQLQLRQENRLSASGSSAGNGLSTSLNSDFSEDLAYVASLPSKEEQVKWLTANKTALVNKYGQKNYETMLTEPERLFPSATGTTTPSAAPIYGSGNFKNVPLDQRVQEMQSFNTSKGFSKNLGLREDLVKSGYPVKEVDRRLNPIGTALSDAGNWFVNLFKF